MSWTEEDLQLIRDVPLAVRITLDGVDSANRYIVGRSRPENLIEPDKIIEGAFTKILLIEMVGPVLTGGKAEIPFEVTNPTQKEIAQAIWGGVLDALKRNPFAPVAHFGQIVSTKSAGGWLGFVCEPLP